MGLRGPIRQVDSRRGVNEGAITRLEQPDNVEAPSWLSATQRKVFDGLVHDLASARVPIKHVDGHAIAMTAYCIGSMQSWVERENKAKSIEQKIECAKLVARFQRDAQTWVDKICATPQSRARIGLKPAAEKKLGTVASITQTKSLMAAQRKQAI